MAEEHKFTKGYTIPLIQLNSLKSILVFSHKHNSLNKEKLLENPQQTKTCLSPYIVDDFVKEPILKQFYMHDMNTLLEKYDLGKPEHKPKLLEQIVKMEEKRAKQLENHNKILQQNLFQNPVNSCIATLRNEYEKKLSDKNILINELLKKIKQLTQELYEFKSNA